jgi:hypothetical protein
MGVKVKQRTVIKFLVLEGFAGEEIVIHLRNVHGSVAYCHDSVFRWISEVHCGNKELRNKGRPGKPYQHATNAAIWLILQENPNASLRTITEPLSISPGAACMHTLLIGYTLKALH